MSHKVKRLSERERLLGGGREKLKQMKKLRLSITIFFMLNCAPALIKTNKNESER